MTTITANVSEMFSEIDPYDVSNSVANLGESAGQVTWRNALAIAENHEKWLESPLSEACEGMREWCKSTGAWDDAEVDLYSDEYLLAMFAQNIASELRDNLNSDNLDLVGCAELYESTDWERESSYPTGSYYLVRNLLKVDYYTGM